MCHRIRFAMTDKNPDAAHGTSKPTKRTSAASRAATEAPHRDRPDDERADKGSVGEEDPVFGIKERGGRVRAR